MTAARTRREGETVEARGRQWARQTATAWSSCRRGSGPHAAGAAGREASLGYVQQGDAWSVPSPEGHTTASIDRLLAEARAGLDRVDVWRLAAEIEAGALVVDTRPVEQRLRDGALPGAVVVDRNVLEWRLDPTSPHRLPEAADPGRRIIIVCNEGFSSSLAAATLRRLGCVRATDLVDGFQGWLRAGHRSEPL